MYLLHLTKITAIKKKKKKMLELKNKICVAYLIINIHNYLKKYITLLNSSLINNYCYVCFKTCVIFTITYGLSDFYLLHNLSIIFYLLIDFFLD